MAVSLSQRRLDVALAAPDRERIARTALQVGYRTALGILGSREAAEDVAQEVAIKALRHAGRLRRADRLEAWLYRIAARTALREIRTTRSRARAEAEHVRLTEYAIASPPSEADLLVLLEGLPPRQRAALTLRYAFDLSDEAIAAALGCRTATVRSHLFHGRAAVQRRLARSDHDD